MKHKDLIKRACKRAIYRHDVGEPIDSFKQELAAWLKDKLEEQDKKHNWLQWAKMRLLK